MELRQLHTFVSIARFGSFSRAAEHCGYTQSAVTVQIRLLEKELNTRLFERFGRNVVLTCAGEQFLTHANAILAEVEQAKSAVSDEFDLQHTLVIGTIESLLGAKLPPVLHHFRESYPRMSTRILVDTPEHLLEMMDQDRLDLTYILDVPRYSESWYKPYETPVEIVFVAAAASPLAQRAQLSFFELLEQPFYLTEREANYRKSLDTLLAAKNIVLTPTLEASNTQLLIKMLVDSGRGVSFLPYFSVQEEVEKGRLAVLPVKDVKLYMHEQILYHKNKWKTRAMEDFIQVLQQTGKPAAVSP